MPNKCTVVGCRSGYKKKKDEPEENVKQPVFSYPEDSELRRLWIRFVNRPDWMPGEHDGICKKHFESKYLVIGEQRITLNRHLKPLPCSYHLSERLGKKVFRETIAFTDSDFV